MKIKICYDVEKIAKALKANGYNFVKLPVIKEEEDWGKKAECYYFAKPEVSSIEYYYSLWTSAKIKMKDGSDKEAFSSNINSDDKSLVRIKDNDFVSPELTVNDTWIEAVDTVTNWLIKHGASMDLLESSKKEFTVYETVEYEGVPTPSISHGYWAYSSETLVLDEREIESVLDGIEDEILREKIKCILYAKVFKRRR